MNEGLPREQIAAGAEVFCFGEPGNSAYVVESGRVEVLAADGRPLAQLGVGALFGEVALLDQQARTATVRALEPTTLLRIERDHVQSLLKRADPVIRHLLSLLLARFRSAYPGAMTAPAPGSQAPDQEAALRTLMLTRDLDYGLAHGQLELFYQPLIGFAQRNLLGFEALVRWRHPVLGMIMPMEFIGLAEKTGLIHQLGQWVLQQALADWAQLRSFCHPAAGLPAFISVNLSAPELSAPAIVGQVRDLLNRYDIPPRELKIELTETVIIEDREAVGNVLEQLSALGVAIALDDFGTGYAGLDTVKSLPIACLKIDKTFVQDIGQSLRSYEIVQSAIQLALSLGLTTIAEGIEDEETANRLSEMGCGVAQGYHFARPMPLADVAGWLADAAASGRVHP
ncbi:MAG: EAL domain-containing protein [Dechloromonas sp.]|nr:MAG: EAL domain-containing protein [Dechloromonas sp.]